MARICNFPISETKRCKQPVADGRPNCGRHVCEISADQLSQNPTVYEKDGELHVWTEKPDDVYCLIHNDPIYQVLCQVAGEKPPCCLREDIEWRDDNHEYHRDDGPALIEVDGARWWFQHGKRHRDGGPAVIKADGTQEWRQYNQLHRDDGPAVIDEDGGQYWFWYDRSVPEQEHARRRKQSEDV